VPWLLCLAVWLCAAGTSLKAQPAGASASSNAGLTNLLEPGYLERRIAALSNRTDLATEVVQESLQVGRQCIALREDLARLTAERASLLQTTRSASNQLAELRLLLKAEPAEPALDLPEDASASAMEQKAAEVEAELAIAQAEKDRLDQEPGRRADRRAEIAGLIAESRSRIKELESRAEGPSVAEAPDELKQLLAFRRSLSREVNLQKIRNLNLELASYEATGELLAAQQVLARRHVASLEEQISLIKGALDKRRSEESARAAAAAERAQQRAGALELPVVSMLAETNNQLAQSRVSVAKTLRSVSRQLHATETGLDRLRASHDTLDELVAVAKESGVSQDYAIGLALRQEQYALPSKQRFQGDAQRRAEEMTAARIQLIKLAAQQEAAADVERRLAEIRSSLPPDLQDWQKDEAVEECRRLLEEQRTLLSDLSDDYQALRSQLAKLSEAQQQWAREIEQFRALIAEQVLWFRSTDVLRVKGIRTELVAIHHLVQSEVRTGLVPYLRGDWRRHRLVYLVAGLILLALLVGRIPVVRGLAMTCPPQVPEGRLSLKPALLALLYTGILTIPIPAVLLYAGWRTAGYGNASALSEHWARAFLLTGSGLLVIEFLRQACRNPGLAVAHLRWPEHNARLVRFHFSWLIMAGVPLAVLSNLLEGVFLEGVSNRMLFLIAQVLMLVLGHLLLRPKRGLRFSTHDGEVSVQRPLRLQGVYHALAIVIPLSLITLSVLGYTYTARQIWLRVGDSIQWGLVVLLATMMVLHWLTVLRRRMAVQKAEQRKAVVESGKPGQPLGPDLWQVYSQSRRLFSTVLWIIMGIGLWMIWSDMLPALRKLDQIPIPLVSHAGPPAAGSVEPAPSLLPPRPETTTGQPSVQPVEPLPTGLTERYLSVADVLGAVIVVLLTLAASRNLPGFVEMVLLSRVHFRQGEGYAIVTILRYVLLLFGIGWALTLIGITWNKVQWLAAAVTVGIGFGLQEIFANFVSGLILLFERPVRVGDIITVGEVTGTVTRIQMRATTVRNWDQQELVLPNKDLVTGRVINWTLSNDVSRLALPVGLSYQADVKRATALLLEIAKTNPNVRSDPEPFVAFEGFADSTLTVVLRAYVSITVRLRTLSDLNNAILEKFREAGIEIAYPQRDLHLRSVTADIPSFPNSGKDPGAPGS